MNSVSVVIPNYNGRLLLEQYLPYLFCALSYGSCVHQSEVIVVDDASTDDSVAYLSARWQQVHVLRNSHNLGFSKSVNRGIRLAQYDAVCVLNTDMQLAENYFEVLLPMLQGNVFGIYCAIRDPKTGAIIEGRKQPLIRHHKLTYRDLSGEREEGESMYLCGGNALINRQRLVALGGYDEQFSPFYFEDMDLSLRARQRGWTSIYTARTSCLHQHAATIGTHFSPQDVQEIFLRNRVYINYRYLSGITWLLFMASACFHALQEIICHKPYRPYGKALRHLADSRPTADSAE